MSCQTVLKLPVVEFSKENLKMGSSGWVCACKVVREALEEYGCFMAIYDKVSSGFSDEIFGSLQELFHLPAETKAKTVCEMPFFGYLREIPLVPHYESLDVENATSMEAIQSFTNLMWPSGNHHFCEIMQSYAKLVSELDHMATRMIFESYGLEKHYESHIESLTYLLRWMKYGAPKMDETNVGLNPHTDKSFISILHQNQINGLEVQTKDGQWIAVDYPPSSFLVMASQSFLAWSNGRVAPAIHRVTLSGNKERYSIGQFSYKNGITEVLEELVDDEHPLRFKPFDTFGLLRFFFTEEGQKIENVAEVYCGI